MSEENGNVKTIFGIPCEGCTKRAEALSNVNWWGVDTMILAAMALFILGIVLYKNTSILDA